MIPRKRIATGRMIREIFLFAGTCVVLLVLGCTNLPTDSGEHNHPMDPYNPTYLGIYVDVEDTYEFTGHSWGVYDLALNYNGFLLASAGSDGTVKLWVMTDGYREEQTTFTGHTGTVYAVLFHPYASLTLSGGSDGKILVWRNLDGTLITEIDIGGEIRDLASWTEWYEGWYNPSRDPDVLVACANSNGNVDVYRYVDAGDTVYFARTKRYEASSGTARSVALGPEGELLAAGGDGAFQVWRITEDRVEFSSDSYQGIIQSVAFNPDGTVLAVGLQDGTIELWDVERGTLQRTLTGHRQSVTCLDFNWDGQVLASASSDSTIGLWYVPNGVMLNRLEGHQGGVTSALFHPDAEADYYPTLVSAAWDNTIRLWE